MSNDTFRRDEHDDSIFYSLIPARVCFICRASFLQHSFFTPKIFFNDYYNFYKVAVFHPIYFIVCHCFSVNLWALYTFPHTTMDLSSITLTSTTPVCLVCLFCSFYNIPSSHWAHGPKTLRMMMMMNPQGRNKEWTILRDNKDHKLDMPTVAISFIQDVFFGDTFFYKYKNICN